MAAPVVIDLKGSNVAALWQQAILQNVVQPAERGATRGMREWGERTMAASKELVPTDFGALKASGIVSSVQREGPLLKVELGYGGPATKYAVFVHEGTGPAVGHKAFMPPSDALEAWAIRHGFPPGSGFIVARAIGQHGAPPLKYLEKPVLEAAEQVGPTLADAMRQEMSR